MILQFPNPDHPDNKKILNPISHFQKQQILDKAIVVFDASNALEIAE